MPSEKTKIKKGGKYNKRNTYSRDYFVMPIIIIIRKDYPYA